MATTTTPTKAAVSTTLPKDIFGLEVKNHLLIHTALRAHQAQGRQTSAVTLTRGKVRGGGKKPWAQKGTGNARAGSIRSPLWRGGGITFGPTGKENYQVNLPLKAKRAAIKQALSLKAAAKAVQVIPDISLKAAKTKELATLLAKYQTHRQVLLVADKADSKLVTAGKNIAELKIQAPQYLNVFDVMQAEKILITKTGLTHLQKWLGASK